MSQKSAKDVVILGAARTPTGKMSGTLASQKATDLGATAVKAAVDAGKQKVEGLGKLIAAHVIARPSSAVLNLLPKS